MRIVVLLVVATLALSACNTMHGIGQDVQTAGEKLKKASQ